jgi:hypothetical protein
MVPISTDYGAELKMRLVKIFCALVLVTSQSVLAYASERVVDLKLTDEKLEACIKTYAAEQHYEVLADVKEIPCFNRGIKSLQGMEVFTEALVIDVSRNDIRDFTPLFELNKRLGYIDIHANPIACAHMLDLSHHQRQAFRVGFDPDNCLRDGQTQPDAPQAQPIPSQPIPNPAPAPAPQSSTEYSKVQAAVASACGACHQNGKHKDGVALDSEADLLRHGASSLATIESGKMPPDESEWRSSAEGQLVVSYLKDQQAKGRIPTRGGHDDDDDDDEHEHHGHHDRDDD